MLQPIPAIDIIDGKCVRLSKGDYATKKVYSDSPLDMAKEFEACGFKRLHLVDLDGAKSRHVVNYETLEQIASHTSLKIDFGGGIKSDADIKRVFDSGAAAANIGSIAIQEPQTFEHWLHLYGSDRIILAADAKDGMVCTNGWMDESEMTLFEFLKAYTDKGVKYVLCTDISKDGMLKGPATELYAEILAKFPDMQLIASGGVSSMEDLDNLNAAGVPYVVFGKAIYEGKVRPAEVAQHFNLTSL